YRTYDDMNLATLPQPAVLIGRTNSGGAVASKPERHLALWLGVGAALVLLSGGLLIVFAKRRASIEERPLRARDVFKMPSEVDGFAVVALLCRLRTSP